MNFNLTLGKYKLIEVSLHLLPSLYAKGYVLIKPVKLNNNIIFTISYIEYPVLIFDQVSNLGFSL